MTQVDIKTLRLHLPAGWSQRAAGIARLVADELASKPWSTPVDHESLSLPKLRVPAGASDRELAAMISSEIFARAGRSESGDEHG